MKIKKTMKIPLILLLAVVIMLPIFSMFSSMKTASAMAPPITDIKPIVPPENNPSIGKNLFYPSYIKSIPDQVGKFYNDRVVFKMDGGDISKNRFKFRPINFNSFQSYVITLNVRLTAISSGPRYFNLSLAYTDGSLGQFSGGGYISHESITTLSFLYTPILGKEVSYFINCWQSSYEVELFYHGSQIEQGIVASSYEPPYEYLCNGAHADTVSITGKASHVHKHCSSSMLGTFSVLRGFNYTLTFDKNYLSLYREFVPNDYINASLYSNVEYSNMLYTDKWANTKLFSNSEITTNSLSTNFTPLDDGVVVIWVPTSCEYDGFFPNPHVENLDEFYSNLANDALSSVSLDMKSPSYIHHEWLDEKIRDNFSKGYELGYNKAFTEATQTWDGLFPSIFGGIADFFRNILDIQIFGTNLLSILGIAGTILIALLFIRLVIGGK